MGAVRRISWGEVLLPHHIPNRGVAPIIPRLQMIGGRTMCRIFCVSTQVGFLRSRGGLESRNNEVCSEGDNQKPHFQLWNTERWQSLLNQRQFTIRPLSQVRVLCSRGYVQHSTGNGFLLDVRFRILSLVMGALAMPATEPAQDVIGDVPKKEAKLESNLIIRQAGNSGIVES